MAISILPKNKSLLSCDPHSNRNIAQCIWAGTAHDHYMHYFTLHAGTNAQANIQSDQLRIRRPNLGHPAGPHSGGKVKPYRDHPGSLGPAASLQV